MLVSEDVSPDTSLYYLGGELISILEEKEGEIDFLKVYEIMKERHGISIKLLILTLDWLYLLDLIELANDGSFKKCF